MERVRCCSRLRYVLLHNMHQPRCCNRSVKVPVFLPFVSCIDSNQNHHDDRYCPIPPSFFLFLTMWPPLVSLYDPVVNMAVLCYNTPRIGRLHSVWSTFALLSPPI